MHYSHKGDHHISSSNLEVLLHNKDDIREKISVIRQASNQFMIVLQYWSTKYESTLTTYVALIN